jgi:hypothetical protein
MLVVMLLTTTSYGIFSVWIAAVLPILLPGAPLLVLGAGGQPAPELEVPLVQHAMGPIGRMAPSSREGLDHVYHHGRGLPLPRGNAGVEVGRPGFEQGLAHIGADTPFPLQTGSVRFAHSVGSLNFAAL